MQYKDSELRGIYQFRKECNTSIWFVVELLSDYNFYDSFRFSNSNSKGIPKCLIINRSSIDIIDKVKEKGWEIWLFIVLEKVLEISRDKCLNYKVNLVFQPFPHLYLSLKSQSIYSYLWNRSLTYLWTSIAWWMTIFFSYSSILCNQSYLFYKWEGIRYDI